MLRRIVKAAEELLREEPGRAIGGIEAPVGARGQGEQGAHDADSCHGLAGSTEWRNKVNGTPRFGKRD